MNVVLFFFRLGFRHLCARRSFIVDLFCWFPPNRRGALKSLSARCVCVARWLRFEHTQETQPGVCLPETAECEC